MSTPVITLDPSTASWGEIARTVEGTANEERRVQVGKQQLLVTRVCTFAHGVVRTAYVHIKIVTAFENGTLLRHYKENKSGGFDLVFALPPTLTKQALAA